MVTIGRRLSGTKSYEGRWYQEIGGWVVPRDRRLDGTKK